MRNGRNKPKALWLHLDLRMEWWLSSRGRPSVSPSTTSRADRSQCRVYSCDDRTLQPVTRLSVPPYTITRLDFTHGPIIALCAQRWPFGTRVRSEMGASNRHQLINVQMKRAADVSLSAAM